MSSNRNMSLYLLTCDLVKIQRRTTSRIPPGMRRKGLIDSTAADSIAKTGVSGLRSALNRVPDLVRLYEQIRGLIL